MPRYHPQFVFLLPTSTHGDNAEVFLGEIGPSFITSINKTTSVGRYQFYRLRGRRREHYSFCLHTSYKYTRFLSHLSSNKLAAPFLWPNPALLSVPIRSSFDCHPGNEAVTAHTRFPHAQDGGLYNSVNIAFVSCAVRVSSVSSAAGYMRLCVI